MDKEKSEVNANKFLFNNMVVLKIFELDEQLDANIELSYKQKLLLNWYYNHKLIDYISLVMVKSIKAKNQYLIDNGKVNDSMSLYDYLSDKDKSEYDLYKNFN